MRKTVERMAKRAFRDWRDMDAGSSSLRLAASWLRDAQSHAHLAARRSPSFAVLDLVLDLVLELVNFLLHVPQVDRFVH